MAGAERARAKRTPAAAEAALRILAAAMEPGGVMDVRTERDALLAEKARVGEGAEDALEAVRAQAKEFEDEYNSIFWNNGYNSAVLAVSRLFLELAVSREMLLNIVRLRFGDPIQFLEVGQINAQFSVGVTAGGDITNLGGGGRPTSGS